MSNEEARWAVRSVSQALQDDFWLRTASCDGLDCLYRLEIRKCSIVTVLSCLAFLIYVQALVSIGEVSLY